MRHVYLAADGSPRLSAVLLAKPDWLTNVTATTATTKPISSQIRRAHGPA